jgi:hypothetical protein
LTVNHKKNFVDPTDGTNTQLIENAWARAKKNFKVKNGVPRQKVQSLLDFICFFTTTKMIHLKHF